MAPRWIVKEGADPEKKWTTVRVDVYSLSNTLPSFNAYFLAFVSLDLLTILCVSTNCAFLAAHVQILNLEECPKWSLISPQKCQGGTDKQWLWTEVVYENFNTGCISTADVMFLITPRHDDVDPTSEFGYSTIIRKKLVGESHNTCRWFQVVTVGIRKLQFPTRVRFDQGPSKVFKAPLLKKWVWGEVLYEVNWILQIVRFRTRSRRNTGCISTANVCFSRYLRTW